MKIRKKLIELTPDWVLEKTPDSSADGEGNGTFYTNKVADSHLIELALSTLGIKYKYNEYGDHDLFRMGYDFRIEDIKEYCPFIYKMMSELNIMNKKHKDQRRLMDLN